MDVKEPDFDVTLLRYLQRLLACPRLEYKEPPTRIAPGTEAWILGFSLQGAPRDFECPLVLRVLHTDGEPYQVATEHAVQNAVAEQGFPAPYVLGSSNTGEVLGWPFLVMKLLPGEPRPNLPNGIELQMEALARLHSLDTEPFEQAMRAHGVPAEQCSGSMPIGTGSSTDREMET